LRARVFQVGVEVFCSRGAADHGMCVCNRCRRLQAVCQAGDLSNLAEIAARREIGHCLQSVPPNRTVANSEIAEARSASGLSRQVSDRNRTCALDRRLRS